MLTYGGLALLLAGILMMVIPHKLIKDPEKAARAKKNAPVMALVGAGALVLAFVLGGMLA